MIDMHVHTNHSDGEYSPKEVLQMAKDIGITHMAITDHDTISGLKEAHQYADSFGIRLLNGVELASGEYRSMHILCLGFKYPNDTLQTVLDRWLNGRKERAYRICDYLLRVHSIDISIDEVKTVCSGEAISRVHFAQVLKSRGYVNTIQEAFEKYLDTKEFQSVDSHKPTTERILDVIKQSGGMSVLAHPSSLKLDDATFDSLICRLKTLGLNGLECYYSKHDKAMTEKYIAVAKKYNLLITGGSDFHGEHAKPNLKLGTGYDNTFYYNDMETFNVFYNHQLEEYSK